MKTMTCRQLAGACDKAFQAESFDAMGNLSRQHAMEMAAAGDAAHIEKMDEMRAMMSKPEAMQEWFETARKAFENLPEDA